ncbi:MAG TPA: phosphoribosyl-AMP cyclohydrolase [Pelagibacterium sp.]|uniref:phosphoribosyl-AMP cyclohydrolase n=1 Tax=Pelagibacterium sp. TaxID=1967288 RepID=UPI002BF5B1BB|nr:phosphoribosyl-AMP cyclohydrolase [Pelagibacterium sp.]HWJ87158.1 phosphoribosyl-AMP cyclohydrolase [Pelagibacterium sp.]
MKPFADSATLSGDELEAGSVFAPRFDANGLVTAVTVEAQTNEILMVAHMNADAIAETLRSGFATYWSRSRNTLWKKGESSGELQKLVEMRTDCDQDALIVVVEQTGRGAACHTGRKTCFYRTVQLDGDEAKLRDNGAKSLFDPNEVYGKG